jgi:hypothetical protein
MHKISLTHAVSSLVLATVIASTAFASTASGPDEHDLLQDSTKNLSRPDSSATKARAVFFGLTYGSNSSYLGRYQTEVLPYVSADISYVSKTGFSLSLFTYDISSNATLLDEVDAMAGWSFDLSKRVDASAFYTRFFFNESTESIRASVQNVASASLGLDWSYLYTKVTAHYIFGDANDFFAVLDNSRYFSLGHVFRKDDNISLEPKATIIAGTQTFVDTHYVRQGIPLIRPGLGQGNGNGNGRGNSGSTGTRTTTVESSETTFEILSYEFSLPITYDVGRFSLELSGKYSIPVNLLEGDSSVPQFFFTGGVLYYISSK